MRLRYTVPAARGLDKLLNELTKVSPKGARRLGERIWALTNILINHPHIGQATSRPGMRRIVVTPFPYLIFYRTTTEEIIIHAVRHAARDPSSMPGRP